MDSSIKAAASGIVENYIAAAAKVHFARRRDKLNAIKTQQAFALRQAEVRAACVEIIGEFPDRAPLKTRSIAILERDAYAIELLTYESLPGVITTANLYLPRGRSEPWPGVACFTGNALEGKAQVEYQRLGRLLAARGIAALLFDCAGQGERLELYDATLRRSWLSNRVDDERAHFGNLLFLTGHHLANWMLLDALRGLDALLARPDIDPARLGVTGDGPGGALSALLCCLEPRLSAAALICDHLELEALGGEGIEKCLFDIIPHGISPLDLLAPFAPKPLLLAAHAGSGKRESFQQALAEVQRWYALFGSEGKKAIAQFEGESGHGYAKSLRARTADHFAHAFGLGDEHIREPDTPPEPPLALHCTETGQVSNSLNAVSIFSFHKNLARELPPMPALPQDSSEALAFQEETRNRFAPCLRLPEASGPVKSEVESRSSDWGLMVERGRLVIEQGLYVPYSFYSPPEQNTPARRAAPTLLTLHERGVAGVSSAAAWMQALPAAGFHVIAIDVCGIGETRLQPERDDADAHHTLLCGAESVWARRALNAGLNLFGLQVFSVLRALSYLKTRWDVDKNNISLAGIGRGALWGLYAAALDRGVRRVAALRGLSTYKSLTERHWHNHHFSLFLPGCLKRFDLPHVAACIAPRPLVLINTVNQRKQRREEQAVRQDYALTAEVYKQLGAAEEFQVATTDSAPETLARIKAGI